MIEFKQVSKTYPNGTHGLKNIHLHISEGDFVVIVGLSGAGKSTLLRSINRLHEISEGEIIVNHQSITKAKGKELYNIRRDIGMVFQNFNLIQRSSVIRNVLSGRVGYHSTLRMILGWFPREDKDLALRSFRTCRFKGKSICTGGSAIRWTTTKGFDCSDISSRRHRSF